MSKHKRQEEGEVPPSLVRSKYFTIDSYFRSGGNDNKRVKKTTQFDKEVEKAIALSLEQEQEQGQVITEQCPLCHTIISTEVSSLEIHVNTCLDLLQGQKENGSPPPTSSLDLITENSSSLGSFKDKCVFNTSTESSMPSTSFEGGNNDMESKDSNDLRPSTKLDSSDLPKSSRVLPSAWKDLFSATNCNPSSNDRVSLALVSKDINTMQSNALKVLSPVKQRKACPFYKRVRGIIK